jgi:hypothetical protein
VTLPNSAAATEAPRAAWLVDMAYVVKASRGAFPLDYRNAAHHLRRRVGTLKCHLFNGYDQRFGVPRGLSAFYAAMESEGMDLHLYPMDEDQEGANRQRRVDVAIGAYLVHAAATGTETVILTTGDSDLIPAVDIATQALGATINLLTYRHGVAHQLHEASTAHWYFEDDERTYRRR